MAQTLPPRAHVGPSPLSSQPFVSKWSARYRGASVQDLEPPSALSLNPTDTVSMAMMYAFEREYTHLTVVDADTRALMGYIAMPALQAKLESGEVSGEDPLSKAMMSFQRKGKKYQVITLNTPLEDLEAFFEGHSSGGQKQDFAVVSDEDRKFVMGVATRSDLEEFVKRRPA
ncbi:cystathionine beta-synthase [Microdochium nivale]|nr:cystathionine beta-synthase [Microdochium nivale]